nr:MAG TPA: hypothetical protein [Caudoviricetes sp.]
METPLKSIVVTRCFFNAILYRSKNEKNYILS